MIVPVAISCNSIVYPKTYAHGFVVLCFVVVMQSFIMNSHEVFIHIHQGCFAGTGAIVRLPQCQWSKPDGYWKISQCITTTKHSKAKTVCIFLGIYCTYVHFRSSLYIFVIVNNLAWTAMADSYRFAPLIPYVCIFSILSVNDLTAIDAKSSADTILTTNYLDFVPIPQSIYTIYTLRPEQNEWHVVVFMLSAW